MKVTYIHHSCFLVETKSCYYLFDYEKGCLPEMDVTKPIYVLSSHGHPDHYHPEIFSLLKTSGMHSIQAVLSDDIEMQLPNLWTGRWLVCAGIQEDILYLEIPAEH